MLALLTACRIYVVVGDTPICAPIYVLHYAWRPCSACRPTFTSQTLVRPHPTRFYTCLPLDHCPCSIYPPLCLQLPLSLLYHLLLPHLYLVDLICSALTFALPLPLIVVVVFYLRCFILVPYYPHTSPTLPCPAPLCATLPTTPHYPHYPLLSFSHSH